MKYLKYLLGIILLLVVIFFVKGLLTPSVSYESEVTVDKPIQEAWDVMSDPTRLPEWLKGFKKTELVSGTMNTVGAISKIYIEENGQEMVMQETITKITPPSLIAMNFSMDFMDMDYEMTLEEKDGKTVVKSNSVTSGNGLFAKSIVSFMTGTMKKQEDENMGNLKKVIESNTKDYTPAVANTVEEVQAN